MQLKTFLFVDFQCYNYERLLTFFSFSFTWLSQWEFLPWEMRVNFLKESRAIYPTLINCWPSVCSIFVWSYTRRWGLLFYDRWIFFYVRINLGACRTHKGGYGSGTNKSAQELTRRERETAPHPAPPGDQTLRPPLVYLHGGCGWWWGGGCSNKTLAIKCMIDTRTST